MFTSQRQTSSIPKTHHYPPCRSLPPGQKPHPNKNFMQDALLTSDPLTFLPESQEDPVSLKKLGEISRSDQKSIMSTCYIPERNLFLVLPRSSKTILIYSIAKNFKLIAVVTADSELSTISYSKELDKILVGGCSIQIWNPITFKLEAQSLQISQYREQAYTLVYLPSPGVVVAKTMRAIYVYSRDLTLLTRFELPPNGCVMSSTAEILYVSQDLLLAVCHFQESRTLLLNLKNQTVKEFDQIEIPLNSCVGVIQETPHRVFTCLTSFTRFFPFRDQLCPYKLIQFTIEPETEELVISRVTKTDHSFHRLRRLENSKYFLAEGYNPSNISELFLLSIEKDQVKVIRVISGLTSPIGSFIMMKNQSLMVHENGSAICLYKCATQRKSKKSLSQEGDLPKTKAEEENDLLQSYLP